MKLKVFAVFDSAVKTYARPFLMQSTQQAVRAFGDLANDSSTEVHKHPQDYTLFEIAEYDEERGCYENLQTPHSLGVAIEYKKKDLSPVQL